MMSHFPEESLEKLREVVEMPLLLGIPSHNFVIDDNTLDSLSPWGVLLYVVFEREAREFKCFHLFTVSTVATGMTRVSLIYIIQENHPNSNAQMHTRISRILISRFALEHRYGPPGTGKDTLCSSCCESYRCMFHSCHRK